MAYADLIEDETASSQYLVVLRPRRRATSFTVYSGSVYVATFNYGEVVSAWADGGGLAQGVGPALSAGEFYYDVATEQLYVRLSGGGDPNSVWLVAEYQLFVATLDAHFHSDPTDDTTRVVYYEPVISKSNMIKQSSTDAIFGFSPVQSSHLTLINAEHIFERHMHDVSWSNARCLVYHWVGDLDVANVKLVMNGLVLSNKYDPPTVSLRVVDRSDILSQEWAHATGDQLFTTATFAALDPAFDQKPIRKVYGFITGGFVPVNVDYVAENPTTSDNRDWVVCNGQSNLSDVSTLVPASPTSTTTRTYLTSANGFNVDDTVWIDKASDEYVIVTAVGANYIEHAALSVAATTGDIVNRAFVGHVKIVQDDVEYTALYGRDYSVSTALAGGTSGFSFNTSLEANLSIPNTLRTTDRVYCRVYGPSNFVTLGGPAFGSNDSRTANMAHPAQIVLDVLKGHVGITEAEILAASFTSALTDQSSGIGVAIPSASTAATFPKYKDVISDILKSALAKLIINADGQWELLTIKPLGAVDKTIADDEILVNSISWDYSYDDVVGSVVVEYAQNEAGPKFTSTDLVSAVSSISSVGTYLHKSTKIQTHRSLWAYATEAQELADRLAFILGERSGTVSFRTKNRFYTSSLGDNIEIQRAYLPGNDVDGETIFTREHAVSEVDKGRTQVTITLDDRKGVEDNAGGW